MNYLDNVHVWKPIHMCVSFYYVPVSKEVIAAAEF